MSNYIKYLLFIILLFTINASKTLAISFKEGNYISNAYINRVNEDGYGLYSQIRFIINEDNNKVLYCLEPFRTFISNKNYDLYTNNYHDVLNISLDTWLKIEAYAYFGYLYENHTDEIWYAVTQLLIWRTLNPSVDIYFTDKINGKRTNKYDSLIQELDMLVNTYLAKPSFDTDIELNLGDKLTFNLEGYSILEDDNLKVNNGYLIINANTKLDKEYTLYKGGTGVNELYISKDSQNIFASLGLSLLTTNLHLKVNSGNITVNFTKEEGIYSSCVSSQENIFGLYDIENNLIKKINVDYIDAFQSEQLPYGKYYLKQISNSCDIKKDMNKYEIEINKENEIPFININLEKVKSLITINKKYVDNEEYYPEGDAEFIIFDKNRSFSLKTDENGIAKITMGAGEYTIKQVKGKENYEFAGDYTILINQSTGDLQIDLINKPLMANIEVLTIDNIGNILKNISVTLKCSDSKALEENTNEDGKVLFDNIMLGEYVLVPSEIPGYQLLDNIDILLQEDMKIILEYEKIVIPDNSMEEPNMSEETVDDEIQIPNTASNFNVFWTILASVILFLGMYINYED